MRIGLDFGTTNSGAGCYDGRSVHLFHLDPAAEPETVMPSALYLTRDHQAMVGRTAIDTYYQENIGRPRKLVRQYVGELEQLYSDGMRVIEEVYSLVDEWSPGRLLRSLKSELSGTYTSTKVFGRTYDLEELISLILGEIRRRVENETGEAVTGVVLGRPVQFVGVGEPPADQRAEARLHDAAMRAGFLEVSFELEPVAAALHYELSVQEPQNILVFDFGGGTLDLTVMRVGDPAGRTIYAVGGIGIAGDQFDRRMVEQLLLDHFGRGTTWGDDHIPFPRQYVDALLNWRTLLQLNRSDTLRFLQNAQATGDHPGRLLALHSVIANDEGIRLYDEVERAKIGLSHSLFSLIRLKTGEINIWQPVTRSQFEMIIGDDVHAIRACLMNTLDRSGLSVGQVDAVIRTGGSSQIPGFVSMLEEVFGAGRVVPISIFSGVTAGLAIRAASPER
jgi:hypothetical chaperone protein